jgi:hypothetical protein
MRNFYRWILATHPRAFRERFENEMLCVFEEALATEGSLRLMMEALFLCCENGCSDEDQPVRYCRRHAQLQITSSVHFLVNSTRFQ